MDLGVVTGWEGGMGGWVEGAVGGFNGDWA